MFLGIPAKYKNIVHMTKDTWKTLKDFAHSLLEMPKGN